MYSSKEQERAALEQIREIVDALGEDSYVGTAFDGCFDIAAANIEDDSVCNMKQSMEILRKEVAEYQLKIGGLTKELDNERKETAKVKMLLEKEQEWHDYELEENIKQCEYEDFSRDSCMRNMTDLEAAYVINGEFGFEKDKIGIVRSTPVYQSNRHGYLRKVGEAKRDPLYGATDWNYIRFDCCGMQYEMYNGKLRFFFD